MKTRILTAVLIVAVMIAVLCVSSTCLYSVAIAVLSVMATFEVLRVPVHYFDGS